MQSLPLLLLLATLSTAVSAQQLCVQVITYGQNPQTGTWIEFPTPCDVPEGWVTSFSAPDGYTEPVVPAPSCVEVENDLSFTLECARYQGTDYRLELAASSDQGPIHWNLAAVPEVITPVPDLSLGIAASGAEVELAVGETLELRLPSNPTTGYSWSLTELDRSVLQPDGHHYHSECETPIDGCGGEEQWFFTAEAAGRTPLTLVYWRAWEGESSQTQRFSITVVVD